MVVIRPVVNVGIRPSTCAVAASDCLHSRDSDRCEEWSASARHDDCRRGQSYCCPWKGGSRPPAEGRSGDRCYREVPDSGALGYASALGALGNSAIGGQWSDRDSRDGIGLPPCVQRQGLSRGIAPLAESNRGRRTRAAAARAIELGCDGTIALARKGPPWLRRRLAWVLCGWHSGTRSPTSALFCRTKGRLYQGFRPSSARWLFGTCG